MTPFLLPPCARGRRREELPHLQPLIDSTCVFGQRPENCATLHLTGAAEDRAVTDLGQAHIPPSLLWPRSCSFSFIAIRAKERQLTPHPRSCVSHTGTVCEHRADFDAFEAL